MPSYQVTLTSANTNYRLLSLVRAIDSAFIDKAGHLSIQVDPSPAGTVLVGDENLATDRYGLSLQNGEGKIYGDGITVKQSLGKTYARSATAGIKVNVEVKR